MDRRRFLISSAAAASARPATAQGRTGIAPTWRSLAAAYRVPDWFRDAKFGIWAHWGPQCQPEFGDWYARLMYVQGELPWIKGDTPYDHHLKHYGHPSRTGFLDIIGQWKAPNWEPETLIRRYARAGARYFFAMGCHHDNFDNFASSHHQWNSTRIGPERDILGGWEPHVRAAGLKYGISNHSSHAWHWYQVAYGYDAQGPMRGRRYDAYWLRRRHGKGKFWEGLDPQDLYTGPYYVAPAGISSDEAMAAWHDQRDGQWLEGAPIGNSKFVETWLRRQNELVDRYRPDLLYFDDSGFPFGETGLAAAAHFYDRLIEWHGGTAGVIFGKKLGSLERRAIVEDVERGFVDDIRSDPWQADTCIGQWHYSRPVYENNEYKKPEQVIQRLADTVSKNGNLLLSIPVRGDGTIDEKEEAIVDRIGAWIARNGEAIFATRPWHRFGEGPVRPPTGVMEEDKAKPFTSEDIRFTAKSGELYAIFLDWPQREAAIRSLGLQAIPAAIVERITLVGGPELRFRRDGEALRLTLPPPARDDFIPVLRIDGRGLA